MLADWDTSTELSSLTILNLRYDVTPASLINGIITNYETIAPTSASVIASEESRRHKNNIIKQHRIKGSEGESYAN